MRLLDRPIWGEAVLKLTRLMRGLVQVPIPDDVPEHEQDAWVWTVFFQHVFAFLVSSSLALGMDRETLNMLVRDGVQEGLEGHLANEQDAGQGKAA